MIFSFVGHGEQKIYQKWYVRVKVIKHEFRFILYLLER